MANRIPHMGEFTVPSDLLDIHEWMVDGVIDGVLGTLCRLEYPPSDAECTNCLFDPSTGRSANIYKTGGPTPFANHTICPRCGGEGRLSSPESDEIRLRVYFGGGEVNAAMRQFKTLPASDINAPDGLVFVIGYMDDVTKFQRAVSIYANESVTQINIRCERFSEIIPWGFRKNRYFACMLKRG